MLIGVKYLSHVQYDEVCNEYDYLPLYRSREVTTIIITTKTNKNKHIQSLAIKSAFMVLSYPNGYRA